MQKFSTSKRIIGSTMYRKWRALARLLIHSKTLQFVDNVLVRSVRLGDWFGPASGLFYRTRAIV